MITVDGQILLKIYPKLKDSLSLYYVRVWIDRNQDNDFNDTAELVWDSGSKLISGNLVNNIYLPSTKIDSLGRTTIRIASESSYIHRRHPSNPTVRCIQCRRSGRLYYKISSKIF
jgi:hypothetical protein